MIINPPQIVELSDRERIKLDRKIAEKELERHLKLIRERKNEKKRI